MNVRRSCGLCWMVAVVLLSSCSREGAHPQAGTKGCEGTARYELRCDATSTESDTDLFCVRHDTRTGDVKRVVIGSLPVSNGPSAAAAGPDGTYALECRATFGKRSDFFCIRLHTGTGDMLLVALPKVGVVPEGTEKVPAQMRSPDEIDPLAPIPEPSQGPH